MRTVTETGNGPRFVAAVASVLALTACGQSTSQTQAEPDAEKEPVQVVEVADTNEHLAPTIDALGRLVFAVRPWERIALPQGRCADLADEDPQFRSGTLVWARVAGTTVPLSSTDGPQIVDPVGQPTAIAPTPRGAVLAGINLVNAAARSGESALQVAYQAFTVSPDALNIVEDMRLSREALINQIPPRPGDGTAGMAPTWAVPLDNVVAYRIRGWTEQSPLHAVVDYASQISPGRYTARTYVVHWMDDKWRLEADTSGPTSHTAEITALDGWNLFPAANSTVEVCGQQSQWR